MKILIPIIQVYTFPDRIIENLNRSTIPPPPSIKTTIILLEINQYHKSINTAVFIPEVSQFSQQVLGDWQMSEPSLALGTLSHHYAAQNIYPIKIHVLTVCQYPRSQESIDYTNWCKPHCGRLTVTCFL